MGYLLADEAAGQSLKKTNGIVFIVATLIFLGGIFLYQHYFRYSIQWISLYELNQSGSNVVFVDARDHNAFAKYHIPGALALPYNELEEYFSSFKINMDSREPDASRKFVVYCEGGQCRKSHEVARFMNAKKIKNVYILRGGLESWQIFYRAHQS